MNLSNRGFKQKVLKLSKQFFKLIEMSYTPLLITLNSSYYSLMRWSSRVARESSIECVGDGRHRATTCG